MIAKSLLPRTTASDTGKFSDYRRCLRTALAELRRGDAVNAAQSARLYRSAIRAFRELNAAQRNR